MKEESVNATRLKKCPEVVAAPWLSRIVARMKLVFRVLSNVVIYRTELRSVCEVEEVGDDRWFADKLPIQQEPMLQHLPSTIASVVGH